MFSDAEGQLQSAGILPECPYHKEGARIVRELLKKGSISRNTYYSLVGADIGDMLLKTNIFAFHFYSRKITFQSTVMKRFCEENSALWKENEYYQLAHGGSKPLKLGVRAQSGEAHG